MCKFGDNILLNVPIPANLSYTGKFRWDKKGIDKCIAPIIQALNDAGIYTANSCCGHGKEDGNIILHDGRIIIIKQGCMVNQKNTMFDNAFTNAELLLEEVRRSNIKPKSKGKEIFEGYSLVRTNTIEAIESYFDSRERHFEEKKKSNNP